MVDLAPFDWTANNHALTWELLKAMKKEGKNAAVLLGKKMPGRDRAVSLTHQVVSKASQVILEHDWCVQSSYIHGDCQGNRS
jgi:hypothetical protein